jgi:hypothetical protein
VVRWAHAHAYRLSDGSFQSGRRPCRSELLKDLPTERGTRAPRDPEYRPRQEEGAPAPFAPRESLAPQPYQRSEAPRMLPYLIGLHKKQPQSAKITRRIALTCLRAGQPREALYWFTLTYHRERSDLKALWNMAALAWRLGDRQAATAYLHEYAARDRESAWGRLARDFLQSDDLAGIEMGSAFSGISPRGGSFGSAGGGASGGVASGSSGLFVLQGERVDPRSFENSGDTSDPTVAVKDPAAEAATRKPKRPATRTPVEQPLGKAFVPAPDEPSPSSPVAPPPSPAPPAVAAPSAADASPAPLPPGTEAVAASAAPLVP